MSRLSIGFATLHKATTYLFAYLGFIALGLGGDIPWPTYSLALVLGLLTVFAEPPRINGVGWQRGSNVVLVSLLLVQVARGVAGEPPLSLALEFSMALQVARLANRRRAPEHQQIALLAFLHLCAATVLSTEIVYGLVFLGFVLVAPSMLALTHLRSEIERHYERSEHSVELGRVLASRRLVGTSFLLGTASLALPLFLISAFVFVLFPRIGTGFLGFTGDRGRAIAGFSDEVTLGDVGVIRDDRTVVLRVLPTDAGHTPPPWLPLRLRGTSFDHYDGRRWTRTDSTASVPRAIGGEIPLTRLHHSDDRELRIVLDHLDPPVVFLPAGAVALSIPPHLRETLEIPRPLTLFAGFDLRYDDPDALGLRYTTWIDGDRSPAVREELEPSRTPRYLEVPDGHGELVALAERMVGDASTPRARAERIERALAYGDYRYSLVGIDPGARPPLLHFLFTTRSGHCEYFASAMVLLLRSVGVPARNVTGFLGARWNSYGRYYAVASGDAHAWVEAYLPEEGWVTFDPTPPGRNEVLEASGLWANLRAMSDALRMEWSSTVVGFDLRDQGNIVRALYRGFRVARGMSGGSSRPSDASPRSSSRGGTRVVAVLFVALALVGGVVLWRRRRRGPVGAPPNRAARRALSLVRDLERILARAGHARPSATTPRAHVMALVDQGIVAAADAQEIVGLYEEIRFGGEELDPSREAAARLALGRIEASLAASRRAA